MDLRHPRSPDVTNRPFRTLDVASLHLPLGIHSDNQSSEESLLQGSDLLEAPALPGAPHRPRLHASNPRFPNVGPHPLVTHELTAAAATIA